VARRLGVVDEAKHPDPVGLISPWICEMIAIE
jgi:hypothetical protein